MKKQVLIYKKHRRLLKRVLIVFLILIAIVAIYSSLFIFGTNYDVEIDPELISSTRFIPNKVITRNNLARVRAVMNFRYVRDVFLGGGKDFENISVTKKQINTPDGEIGIFIYEQKEDTAIKPGMLWIHGGGYIMGQADEKEPAKLAEELNLLVRAN